MALVGLSLVKNGLSQSVIEGNNSLPIVISTWNHGLPANEAAWEILANGGNALDAVEAGVRVPEADPKVITVGYGGIPDASGKVTLDACIMDERGRAGSVACLENIKHPISVARLVMEKTPHVMLTGKGAHEFALENGFKKENLLTPEMKEKWKKWKKEKREFSSKINIENQLQENHDTIGMLAIDKDGRISGACTTSGMGFKLPGRVGDSPIIGAGLFVDGEIGGATATGTGELVMKTLGSFLVVELMRNGKTPAEACEEAVKRIAKKIPDYKKHQVGFIALNISGEYGSFCIQPGFNFAVKTENKTALEDAEAWLKTL
jgi:isoaspartyl peptidase/L-asparaginase-like protein (Ntn-hydrolase superfamily)